jgi:para-aminobenzoate synthetase
VSAAAELAARVRGLQAPVSGAMIVAVEGRPGAGKTTFGSALASELGAVHVDLENLYPGWEGLEEGARLAAVELVAPAAASEVAVVPQWNWVAMRPAEPLVVEPTELLVISGTGSGSMATAPHLALVAWMELGDSERRHRAMERDGETFAPHWQGWGAQVEAHLERERTRERADVVIDTSGPEPVLCG